RECTHMREWFTLVEVQAYTDLPVHKIKEAIQSGQLPASREGSRYVIRRDDLIELMVKVTGKTEVRVRYELDRK
ncbi:MAG: helix-turn-helix domain-containing protein, partial [Acidobacteriota bacterium]|nr:helix-turn-helix domain-containing protein [Acidobacteriota bacterium]